MLLGFAVGEDGPALDPAQLRYVGRHLHEVLDPDAADQLLADRLDREEAETYRRRFLSLVDDGMGGVRIRGLVTAEAGAILRAVLHSLAAPAPAQRLGSDSDASPGTPRTAPVPVSLVRTQPIQGSVSDGPSLNGSVPDGSAPDRSAPSGHVPGGSSEDGDPGPNQPTGPDKPEGAAEGWLPDHRTPEQRLADALVEAGERLIASGGLPSSSGERPQLVVTVDYDRLAAGVGAGCLVNGDELSPSAVRRIACDAGVIPAVLGGDSQPLDLGRSARTATPAQRRALALRDGGCAFPGCDRPPGWCRAHHLRYWEDLGPTDLENLVSSADFIID